MTDPISNCPQCGWNSAMDGPVLPAPDDGLVGRLKYRVENPSAWDCFDQGGSDLCREAAAALQSKDGQIERLEREKDGWKDACMQAREGCNQRSDTIRSLLSRLSRAMEAMTPSADTQAAYTNRIQIGVELRAGDEVEFRSLFVPWNGIRGIMDAIRARAARETEGGK